MDFRIADTFTDSLARLTGDEQKAAKTTAFDLQMNPACPGMSFHKLDKAKDKNFWSIRVGADIRLIVHKTPGSLLLCYVDHHDKAYDWAERRKLETHPKTGAAQWVEIRETVKEVVVPVYVQTELPLPPKPLLFAHATDDQLLGYGVPPEWLSEVRQVNEDSLLTLADRLPGEAAEALLELATGGKPRTGTPVAATANPFDHPDAQRRFRIMANVDELKQALEYPWDKWTVFLHPEQRQLVERDYRGPARVAGSAGTGKTIVALHRAVHLAKANPDSRVLLTTFSDTLASALHTKLKRLVGSQPHLADRIDVASLDAIAQRLHRSLVGPAKLISSGELKTAMLAAAQSVTGHKFSLRFLLSEWDQVVDAWQLMTWDAYRDVARLGRKTRLPEAQRKLLWSIMERVRTGIAARGAVTAATLFTSTAVAIGKAKSPPFDFAVVDEAQDIGVPHLRFLAAFARREDALFFAGDLGQRIFQTPFSWKALGVDVRGRSRTLRVNYRTSHQIRTQADRLLAGEMTDVDGNKEDRRETVSVFNGPAPTIQTFETQPEESKHVGGWIRERVADGLAPHEIAVFVRSTEQLGRAEAALREAKIDFKTLDERVDVSSGRAALCTMHLAKGLEFRAVAVMACDDEIVPLQERIESVGDTGDLQEVYDTERHLLYVACTRARDHLLITSTEPASEFLDDLRGK
ncbi:MAG: UvrD-helicase domain-containing protein [Opitutaceae bacterium]|nr:UvrD-helicase domain-containing protein [Opitutaceae bacterium]